MSRILIFKAEQLKFSPYISSLHLTASIYTCSEMKYLVHKIFAFPESIFLFSMCLDETFQSNNPTQYG